MFEKRHTRREFKLNSRADKPPPEDIEEDEKKHVRIEPPDRTSYPRLLDNWMIILVFALLILFLIFIMRWLSGGI
ncbi:MAG TPA: hypothetical protein ENN75_01770 [candidate division Zixibacteria bacterium]|nr:hypothetical protein [candidate division Zixibacteria bacterium]